MALTTKIARHFALRQIIMAVVCLVLGLWGLYDYTIKIPDQKERWERWDSLKKQRDELAAKSELGPLTDDEITDFEAKEAQLNELGSPTKPGEFDRLVKGLAFVPCLPFVPYFLWVYARTKRRVYSLDDDGTLSLPGGEEWPQAQVAEIDMSRWMAKSIAYVVHQEGTRVKLDDYKHRDLHLIIGAIASRLYPQAWDAQAKQVKADEAADDADTEAAMETQTPATPPETVS